MLAGTLPAQTPDALRVQARAGDVQACMKLAEWFDLGIQVPQNSDSSTFYIRIAAKTGYAPACYLLGTRLVSKVSDAKRFTEGMTWLKRSADSGNVAACKKLTELHSTKPDAVTGQYPHVKAAYNLSLALKFAVLGSDRKEPSCALYAARSYWKGLGTVRTDSLAWVHGLRSAALGAVEGQLQVADWYLYGNAGRKTDLVLARKYYEMALVNKNTDIDYKTQADVGLHRVDQCFRRWYNEMGTAIDLLGMPFQYYEERD